MKITNTQSGPRGFNAVNGPQLVGPGETVEADVYERESKHIEATGWFDIEGDYTKNPSQGSEAADDDIGALKAKIAQLEGRLAGSQPTGPYEAREKSRGWYAIFDASGAEIGDSMREPEAKVFNALSDEEKAAKVKELKA